MCIFYESYPTTFTLTLCVEVPPRPMAGSDEALIATHMKISSIRLRLCPLTQGRLAHQHLYFTKSYSAAPLSLVGALPSWLGQREVPCLAGPSPFLYGGQVLGILRSISRETVYRSVSSYDRRSPSASDLCTVTLHVPATSNCCCCQYQQHRNNHDVDIGGSEQAPLLLPLSEHLHEREQVTPLLLVHARKPLISCARQCGWIGYHDAHARKKTARRWGVGIHCRSS